MCLQFSHSTTASVLSKRQRQWLQSTPPPQQRPVLNVSLEIPVMLSHSGKQGSYCVQVLLCLLDLAWLLGMTKDQSTQRRGGGREGYWKVALANSSPPRAWLFPIAALFDFAGNSASLDYDDWRVKMCSEHCTQNLMLLDSTVAALLILHFTLQCLCCILASAFSQFTTGKPAHGDVSFYFIYKSVDVTLLLPSWVLSYFTQINAHKAFLQCPCSLDREPGGIWTGSKAHTQNNGPYIFYMVCCLRWFPVAGPGALISELSR